MKFSDLNVSKSIVVCLIVFNVVFDVVGQNTASSSEIELKGTYNLFKYIGDINDKLVFEFSGRKEKKATLYKLDEELKIVKSSEIKVKYKDNTRSSQWDFSKDIYVFGNKLYTFYRVKEGKTAIIYYDLINSKGDDYVSEENALFKWNYTSRFMNENFMSFSPMISDDFITFYISIGEVGKNIYDVHYKTVLVRFNKNFEKIYQVEFDNDKYGKVDYQSFHQFENGQFTFSTVDKENHKMAFHHITPTGESKSQIYDIEGLFLESRISVLTEEGPVLTGVYRRSNKYKNEDITKKGIYYLSLDSNIIKFIDLQELVKEGKIQEEFLVSSLDVDSWAYVVKTETKGKLMYFLSREDDDNKCFLLFDPVTESLTSNLISLDEDGSYKPVFSIMEKKTLKIAYRLVEGDKFKGYRFLNLNIKDFKYNWRIQEFDENLNGKYLYSLRYNRDSREIYTILSDIDTRNSSKTFIKFNVIVTKHVF